MISRTFSIDFFPANSIFPIFSPETPAEGLLLFDIETTGLNWKDSMVYLIGFLRWDAQIEKWRLTQWFLDDPSEEKALLGKFSDMAGDSSLLIHYNGQAFDLPYLEGRCQAQQIPAPFGSRSCRQLDLYQTLRPFQRLFGLQHMKLPDLEAYLGSPRPAGPSGKECIALYRKYIAEKQPELAGQLMLHNRQDLTGLLACTQALAYPALFQGRLPFLPPQCRLEGDVLACALELQWGLPRPFSLDFTPKPWKISAAAAQVQIDFHLENGTLRMYYPNYQDYYYLPGEDTAIHKSVGSYVRKKYRRQATPQNCYTRFPCSQDFMQDTRQIENYVRQCLRQCF